MMHAVVAKIDHDFIHSPSTRSCMYVDNYYRRVMVSE
jgi:hypothetical protein